MKLKEAEKDGVYRMLTFIPALIRERQNSLMLCYHLAK